MKMLCLQFIRNTLMKKYGIEENDKIPKKVYEILTDSSYIFPEWDQRIKI